MTMYKNIESRRNGTDLTFESRRNGSRRNGSRRNGSRRNGSRRNGNTPPRIILLTGNERKNKKNIFQLFTIYTLIFTASYNINNILPDL